MRSLNYKDEKYIDSSTITEDKQVRVSLYSKESLTPLPVDYILININEGGNFTLIKHSDYKTSISVLADVSIRRFLGVHSAVSTFYHWSFLTDFSFNSCFRLRGII